MTNKIAEVTKTSTVPVVLDDSFLDQGTGLEDASAEDYAIPFLRILQGGSPQVKKSEGKYIQGSEEGDIFNTVSSEIVKSDKGIIVVPCYYQKKYIEWISRDTKGGGFVAAHDSREILNQTTRNEKGAFILENGNYISETAQFYVLITDQEEQLWSQAVIAMSSTQLSKARKWLSQMRQRMVKNSKGQSVNAPTFLFKYSLKTVAEHNDFGSWYGWSIGLDSDVKNMELAKSGSSFLRMIKAGEIKVQDPSDNEDSSDTGKDDIPF